MRPLPVIAIVIERPSQMMSIDWFYRIFVAATIGAGHVATRRLKRRSSDRRQFTHVQRLYKAKVDLVSVLHLSIPQKLTDYSQMLRFS
jgi:hypothetical protein